MGRGDATAIAGNGNLSPADRVSLQAMADMIQGRLAADAGNNEVATGVLATTEGSDITMS